MFPALALPLLLLPGCTSKPQPLVLLLSWDTTRADALSAWSAEHPPAPGDPHPRTPVADGLADSGVRFSWALSHAPTTLASHTSIMSGLDLHGHAVPRNGYPVAPDLPLVAERFAAAGWDTVAVVGASTLDGDMGLDRGFRVYDDDVSMKVRARYESPGDVVTRRALDAVANRRKDRPLFLFVHYFDPHSPWDSAPDSLQAGFVDDLALAQEEPGGLVAKVREGTLTRDQARRARGLYLAEVAWTDAQTGVLLDGLRGLGLLDDALVVLLGDHGEALDDPGMAPYGHGLDADLPAIHVPLIVQGSGRFAVPAGRVVSDPVRLMDVAPTMLALAGLDPALGQGRDLAPTWRGDAGAAPPSFAEATKPAELERPDQWNNRLFDRSVVYDGHILTVTPFLSRGPSLHRLAPGQPLVDSPDPTRAATLVEMLQDWDRRAPPFRQVELSEQTRKGLEALGYIEPTP